MAIDGNVIIAGVATILGGVGLKVVESWLTRQSRKNTDASDLRKEYREQVVDLKSEIGRMREEEDQIEKEIEQWRSRYYDLRDQYTQKQTELTFALERIKVFQETAEKKSDSAGYM